MQYIAKAAFLSSSFYHKGMQNLAFYCINHFFNGINTYSEFEKCSDLFIFYTLVGYTIYIIYNHLSSYASWKMMMVSFPLGYATVTSWVSV